MKKPPIEAWISRKIGSGPEALTRSHIENWQLERLRETIHLARTRSSFYRTQLAGVSEEGLRSLDEVANLPFTTAEDLRRDPLCFLCVSQSSIERVVTLHTSGTTGEPKRVFFSREDQQSTMDFFHHGMSTLVAPGERVLILMPGERPGSVGDLLKTALERLGARGITHGPVEDAFHTLDIMARVKVDALVGIPVQVLALARYSEGRAAPKAVLLSTDYVPRSVSREIEQIWGCEVFGHYGMTEMGFGGGVECRTHTGYHMREADLFFEIVHPETGAPVPDGEYGEVVFTTLSRHAMPLIRYRTGDWSRFLPDSCPCGTVLKTMERVRGRMDGVASIGSAGALAMADLDEALFPLKDLLDFGVTLTSLSRPQGVDGLHLAVLFRVGTVETAEPAVRRALETIPVVKEAQDKGELMVSITPLGPEAKAGRGTGKRRIHDQRNPGRGE